MRINSIAVYTVAALSATFTAAVPSSNLPTRKVANALVANMPVKRSLGGSDSGDSRDTASREISSPLLPRFPKDIKGPKLPGSTVSFPAIPEDGVTAGVNEKLPPTGRTLEGKESVIQVSGSYLT